MSRVRESVALDKHFTLGGLKSAATGAAAQELFPQQTSKYGYADPYPAQTKIGEYTKQIFDRPGGVTSPIGQEGLDRGDPSGWNRFFDAAFEMNPYPNAFDIWNNKETPFASY